ncbi:MAG: sugar transferase [Chitinophagaceae bacterium]|nr:MAG: sugar transferase [Chitinophagaceae bacterium]
MYKQGIKRVLDFLAAGIGFIILLPVFVCIALLSLVIHKNNPFFFQKRPGLHGKIFSVIKFKTMSDAKDKDGKLLPDAERITWWGKFLRKTSLDEIPQLINVIKGDMSLVGPRPLLVSYLPLYNNFQKRRHEVRPGITGWAQVNGRNTISWADKFAFDVWYVDNISFLLDVKILLLTVKKVLVSDGIAQEGRATVDYFEGNE